MPERSLEPASEPRLRPVRKSEAVEPASKWAELSAALERHSGERLLVLLSGYPDPDSIASGLALQHLAGLHGIESRLLTFHEVSHQENRALVTQLELDLWLYDGRCDLEGYSLYAFVDTPRIETPIEDLLAKKTLLAFVDHHKRHGEIGAEFVDVREDAGSTAAIFADYLREAHPDGLSEDNVEHVTLATALMHGIRSDTRLLLEASRLDFLAAAYLVPVVDHAQLRKISAQSLSPAVMDMIQAALERRKVFDNFLLSDVGFVSKEHRDGIPQAADFLLLRAGIDTVLVFGILDSKTIEGSLRTRSDAVNPDTFLKKAFGGDDERGAPYGGGNVRNKGGFQIPLGFLAQHKDRDQLYRLAGEIVLEKFLAAIGRGAEP
ncbi:MAG: bifunctional oligoribonuclease/PAP phosphatase NrnA [bacterium]